MAYNISDMKSIFKLSRTLKDDLRESFLVKKAPKYFGIFLLLGSGSLLAEGNLYRYTGEKGLVIDDHVPPEYVPKGYEVLNSQGFVIDTVLPALSAEEKAAMSEQALIKQEAKVQAASDAKLLERYSDSGDAVLARDRQTGALETMIVIVEGTIKKLKQEEQKELERAAANERRGAEVPEAVLMNLDSVRKQIRDAEQQVENQKQEQSRIRSEFDDTIARLKTLTGS